MPFHRIFLLSGGCLPAVHPTSCLPFSVVSRRVAPTLPPPQQRRLGNKEQTFFDSVNWLESDCQDDFLSINGVAVKQSLTSHCNMAYLSKCSSREIHMERSNNSDSRGALIVLEGLDRCGKTLQCGRLHSFIQELGHPVESWRFPDRNTGVGQMISSYLANQSHLDDHAIHLLFSANRWEKRSLMVSKLRSGTTLIVDRYAFSGVAFSSAKGLDVDWCKAPEAGLLAPDLVVYLDISPEKAAERGGYGGERYEQLEFQKRVAQSYEMLRDSTWKIVDASLAVEDVEKQLREIVMECVQTCQKGGKPLLELWQKW